MEQREYHTTVFSPDKLLKIVYLMVYLLIVIHDDDDDDDDDDGRGGSNNGNSDGYRDDKELSITILGGVKRYTE
jgi:hypothetical protein